jgi:hypothetical protein
MTPMASSLAETIASGRIQAVSGKEQQSLTLAKIVLLNTASRTRTI